MHFFRSSAWALPASAAPPGSGSTQGLSRCSSDNQGTDPAFATLILLVDEGRLSIFNREPPELPTGKG
ncbi:MAG: hypothetical protein ACYTF6_02540 [Planctomycetota bacterium]|jgi:hypothetical protein